MTIPTWLETEDDYIPVKGNNIFSLKTIDGISKAMTGIKVQKGHEKSNSIPALIKLVLLIILILCLAITHKTIILMAFCAFINIYLCTWPAKDLTGVIKAPVIAALLSLLLLSPAMIFNPSGINNNLMIVFKVFCSVEMMQMFSHTTQWNHITSSLKMLKIPGIFIFTLDISLKYIILLGQMIQDLLTSLNLRSIGKNNKKYQSIGGIMGVTFIRSTEMSKEMYDAMICRCYDNEG